jgi:hypothetical protein
MKTRDEQISSFWLFITLKHCKTLIKTEMLLWIYFLTYLIRSSYTLWCRGCFFFFGHFTDGRTPWTSDQLVARPLHKHRTTQTQNKHIHIQNIHVLCGIGTHDPGFRTSEESIHPLDRSATVTGENIFTYLKISRLQWKYLQFTHCLSCSPPKLYYVHCLPTAVEIEGSDLKPGALWKFSTACSERKKIYIQSFRQRI